MASFRVLTATSNEGPWLEYGEFASEQEWERELPHIRFLQSMGPIYIKRIQNLGLSRCQWCQQFHGPICHNNGMGTVRFAD